MARFLPLTYEPIPDALLWSGADLVDVTRRIARNQNWIWANHGNVLAAFGQEPHTAQTPSVTTGSLDCAYFAAPNRSATGSDSVRCCGYVDVVGGSFSAKMRLYQLLPGENTPTADSPYDEVALSTAGTDVFFDFDARIRSGSDPLRFCLRLIGAGAGTYTLLSTTVTWKRNPTSVLGETVEAWTAISQAYVQPDRPYSAALLRALSNRTLRLMAENPRPLFAHSFLWPRISTAATGVETRVALYSCQHDAVSTPSLIDTLRFLVTGQNAVCDLRYYVNGVLKWTVTTGATALVNGAYVLEGFTANAAVSVPTGDLKLEITAQCTTAAAGAPTYSTNVGAVMLGIQVRQTGRTPANLGLPGADTIPATYQPLDDNACAPGSRVVAQDDKLGRRAGPYYLVKNLVWLAANRTAHVLVADWTHRTQSAGWYPGGVAGGTGVALAGDGYYRNQTLGSDIVQTLPTWWYEEAPNARDYIPWADRASPSNGWNIKDAPGGGAAGHHYIGDVLGRLYSMPMNGGQIAGILRPDVLYPPSDPPTHVMEATGTGEDCDIELHFGATRDARVPASRRDLAGGFRTFEPSGTRPSIGTVLSLRANTNTYGNIQALRRVEGLIAALHSAYIYEAPLSQGELDALA